MKKVFALKDAIDKAKKINPKYNLCVEHPNAWVFSYDDGTDDIRVGGPDCSTVIMKDDGRMMKAYEYYMTDFGEDEIIGEQSI